jgi:hypothetical protein
MRTHTTTTTALLLTAGLLLTGCSSDSSTADAKPEPTKTETTTAAAPAPEPAPLTKEETTEQCTNAVADAAPSWDDWNIDLAGWEDDPRTPEVCKPLVDEEFPPRGNRAFQDALIDGLELAAACGTPDALPGRC